MQITLLKEECFPETLLSVFSIRSGSLSASRFTTLFAEVFLHGMRGVFRSSGIVVQFFVALSSSRQRKSPLHVSKLLICTGYSGPAAYAEGTGVIAYLSSAATSASS